MARPKTKKTIARVVIMVILYHIVDKKMQQIVLACLISNKLYSLFLNRILLKTK